MKKRAGIVKLSSHILEDYDVVRAIQKDMVIQHTEHNYAEQSTTIWCMHPAFDIIETGIKFPEYSVTIHKQNEYITVTFDKII